MAAFTISNSEFQLLRDLVYSRFGINLTDQKKALLVGRLQKELHEKGFSSFKHYYDHLVNGGSQADFSSLINKISTNYSYFYREKAHFEFFRQTVLPELGKKLGNEQKNDLRFWCAGCSTGEEPYTLMMIMLDHFALEYNRWDAGILATDISERVLTVARDGIYPADRSRQLPMPLRQKFLKQRGETVEVAERVRREVVIRRFNLMNPFPFKKPFHIIFCRNVMIYFDSPTRKRLVQKFHDFLEPGGYLFIGHSESISRDDGLFSYVQPALYQKIG